MKRISSIVLPIVAVAAIVLCGCDLADAQMAAVEQERQDCAAAGGYFETNKPGEPDNYTCKGLAGAGPAVTLPAQPAQCRTKSTTVEKPDGTTETNSTQVCASL